MPGPQTHLVDYLTFLASPFVSYIFNLSKTLFRPLCHTNLKPKQTNKIVSSCLAGWPPHTDKHPPTEWQTLGYITASTHYPIIFNNNICHHYVSTSFSMFLFCLFLLSKLTCVLHFRHPPATNNEGWVVRRNQSLSLSLSLPVCSASLKSPLAVWESVCRGPERPVTHEVGIGAWPPDPG